MNITIEFFIFKLDELPVFSLNWQLRFFGSNLPKRVAIFSLKQIKQTPPLNFAYSNESLYQISLSTNNFEFQDQICPRKVFMVKNRKIEHHHWILLIQISLGTKFQLKLTILIFLIRFTQKGFFWSKTKKNTTYFLHNSAYSN